MPLDTDQAPRADAAHWRTGPYNRWAFHHVDEVVPVAVIENAPNDVQALAEDLIGLDGFSLKLPSGSSADLDGFLKTTATDALVIMKDGRVVFERYDGGTTKDTPHILMSVSKAMMGLIAGILQRNGALDVDALVSTYLPQMETTAYRGATIRQLLDMRTGVVLNDEQAQTYDAAVSSLPPAPGESAASFHALLQGLSSTQRPHGGPFSYISANTDLLGWAMEQATGRSVAALASDLLWKPMGAAHDAAIVVDREGAPWCSGGFCMSGCDFARVGDLILNDGRRGGDEIVPKALIDDLCDGGDREAWKTGEWGGSFSFISPEMSYRSGWYSVHAKPKLLFAMGVHGQNLFIDRANRIVIAKLSSQAQRIDPMMIWLTHQAVPELVRCLLQGG